MPGSGSVALMTLCAHVAARSISSSLYFRAPRHARTWKCAVVERAGSTVRSHLVCVGSSEEGKQLSEMELLGKACGLDCLFLLGDSCLGLQLLLAHVTGFVCEATAAGSSQLLPGGGQVTGKQVLELCGWSAVRLLRCVGLGTHCRKCFNRTCLCNPATFLLGSCINTQALITLRPAQGCLIKVKLLSRSDLKVDAFFGPYLDIFLVTMAFSRAVLLLTI